MFIFGHGLIETSDRLCKSPSHILAKQEQQTSTRAASRMPKFRRQPMPLAMPKHLPNRRHTKLVTRVHLVIDDSIIESSSMLARERCPPCLKSKQAIFSEGSVGHEAQTWPVNFTKYIPRNAWTQGDERLSTNKLSLTPMMYQGMINAHTKHVI